MDALSFNNVEHFNEILRYQVTYINKIQYCQVTWTIVSVTPFNCYLLKQSI